MLLMVIFYNNHLFRKWIPNELNLEGFMRLVHIFFSWCLSLCHFALNGCMVIDCQAYTNNKIRWTLMLQIAI